MGIVGKVPLDMEEQLRRKRIGESGDGGERSGSGAPPFHQVPYTLRRQLGLRRCRSALLY